MYLDYHVADDACDGQMAGYSCKGPNIIIIVQ